MTELDPSTLVGEGGLAAGLIWIIYKVGMRMIGAIDRLTNRIERVETVVTEIAAVNGVKIPRTRSVSPGSQTE